MEYSMKLNFCAVCGTTNDLQQHHIEPIIMSGIKRKKDKRYDENKPLSRCTSMEVFAWLFDQGVISDDEELTVCSYHHNILHGIFKFQKAEHSVMIKEGLKKAKENGIILGRPSHQTDDNKKIVKELFDKGLSVRKIYKQTGLGLGTIYKLLGSNYTKFKGTYKEKKVEKSRE